MTCGIEAKRERGLSLAAHSSPRTRSAARSRRYNRNHLGWFGLLNTGNVNFFCGGLEDLGGLVAFVSLRILDAVQPLDDFRLLVVDR